MLTVKLVLNLCWLGFFTLLKRTLISSCINSNIYSKQLENRNWGNINYTHFTQWNHNLLCPLAEKEWEALFVCSDRWCDASSRTVWNVARYYLAAHQRANCDWQYLVANWFAFPYTVYFRQDEQLMIFTQLGVIIAFGNLPLFLLVSPQVVKYSADMVFWSAQIRMHAFYIIFSFHLIVILIFLLIVFCFDLLQHYFSK